jgi:hypothetical protein
MVVAARSAGLFWGWWLEGHAPTTIEAVATTIA